MQQAGDFIFAEQAGKSADAPIACDFVVFDLLRGGDQAGVFDGRAGFLTDVLSALLHQAFHRMAGLALRRNT